jgi:hypothetical protein
VFILHRPVGRFFNYAFCRFSDVYMGKRLSLMSIARKLVKEIRFPEINGKVCRALPYDREARKFESGGSLFVKGLGKGWTHRELYEHFKSFGEITSVKVSL